jgi:hypothetical protein
MTVGSLLEDFLTKRTQYIMQAMAITAKDSYKAGHKPQYPAGTEEIYGNLTARSGARSNIKGTRW